MSHFSSGLYPVTLLDALATALCKAQAEMSAAEKDGKNPHFKSRYSTLTAVWDACRGPLTKNGLSVLQMFHTTEAGGLILTTRLLHTSGQYQDSNVIVPLGNQTPQAIGSAISYMRRYSLASLIGVVSDDDDDGEVASRLNRVAYDASLPEAPAPKKRNPATAIIEALTPKLSASSEPLSITDILPFEVNNTTVVPSGQFKGVKLGDKPRSEWSVYSRMLGEKLDGGELLQEDHAHASELKKLIDTYLKK